MEGGRRRGKGEHMQPPLLAPVPQPGTPKWPQLSYLQGPGRGCKGMSPSTRQRLLQGGRLCEQRAGWGPPAAAVPPSPHAPLTGGKPTLCKGDLTSASLPLPVWKAGLAERWGAQRRTSGSPGFVHKLRPFRGTTGNVLWAPRDSTPRPKIHWSP